MFLGQQRGPHSIESMVQNGYINQMVRTGIDVLCLLSNQLEFQMFFTQQSFKIYMQIVLPYTIISEKEKEDIVSDPHEFVNYQIDICQKQKSRTYKSQAAKLLECIVDHVDGMLTFVVNLNLQIMSHILNGTSASDPYVSEIKQKFSLNIQSDEDFLDACLLNISVLSYSLVKRVDLLSSLDELILIHLDKFLDQGTSVLIKSRFSLFLSFYLDQLFTTAARTV